MSIRVVYTSVILKPSVEAVRCLSFSSVQDKNDTCSASSSVVKIKLGFDETVEETLDDF
jgi:hypothetical protein